MSKFYFNEIPSHALEEIVAVREPVDNLWNILVVVEAINHYPIYSINDENLSKVAIFTENCDRFLIRNETGYFSMTNPFQIVIHESILSFNCDQLQESVGGMLISILKNAITTFKTESHSHENIIVSISENFSLDISESIRYYDTFTSLLSEEHGYFRFDDDDKNKNGHIHPRYHFDIFCTNTSTLKIGTPKVADMTYFLALVDKAINKKYLADSDQVFINKI